MPISLLTRCRLTLFEKSLRWLDRRAIRKSPDTAVHLTTGLHGEDAAYFYLRRMEYVVVARRWRSSRLRGDVDLIGWDGDTLCFIEVKTRSSRAFLPAEVAVDAEKQRMLHRMAREYLRQLPDFDHIPVRFDIVSVYVTGRQAECELFRNAFGFTTWRD